MVHREAGISKIRRGKEIEQLAWCWIGINLLLNASSSSSNDNDYLSNECLRLSSMCLTVSFRLFPKEPLFLNRWYEAFSRLLSSSSSESTPPCLGVVCSLMLLNIGQIVHFYMARYEEEKEKEEEAAAAMVIFYYSI
ncbi:unnamed protein product [Trichobilharzia szidati]|nr:unnamed protein product [Trichobilharzia szidati]